MPNEGDTGSADTSGDVIDQLFGQGDAPSSQTTETATSQPAGQAAQGQDMFEFGGRKFKSRDDADKAYRSLYGTFSKNQERMKRLETILSNEKLSQALVTDPELRDAASRLGLKVAELDIKEHGGAEASEEIDENSVEYKVEYLTQRMQLSEEKASLEDQLGRKLTTEERSTIRDLITDISGLTMRQAYQLAYFEKAQKEAFEKGKTEAAPAGKRARPSPISGILPGQKIDTKKPVNQMNRDEWRESIREALRSEGVA